MTDSHPLHFFVDPSWRRTGAHTPLLNPWWGNPISELSLFTKQAFDSYHIEDIHYTLTPDLQSADMVLVPYPHIWCLRHDRTLFQKCAETALKAHIPLLIDGTGDVEHPVSLSNAYVLRYGGYRFKPDPQRIQIPLFTDDLLERTRNGMFNPREKGSGKPVVGFAGWAALAPLQLLRTLIKETPIRIKGIWDARYRTQVKGVLWRQKAISILEHSPLITFNSHARTSFSGSIKTAEGDLELLREQMVETILESDYALDVKGDANNSARLFEILSLGRIPVIIDTERIFPFSDKLNYSSFSLKIDFRDIKELPERIVEFHNSLSPERFVEMQNNARAAYLQYFRPDAVARHIVEELKEKLSQKRSTFRSKNEHEEI